MKRMVATIAAGLLVPPVVVTSMSAAGVDNGGSHSAVEGADVREAFTKSYSDWQATTDARRDAKAEHRSSVKMWSPQLKPVSGSDSRRMVRSTCYVPFTGFTGGPSHGKGTRYAIGKVGKLSRKRFDYGGLQSYVSQGGTTTGVPKARRSPKAWNKFQLGISWHHRPRHASVVAYPVIKLKGAIYLYSKVGGTGARSSARASIKTGHFWKDHTVENKTAKAHLKKIKLSATGEEKSRKFKRKKHGKLGTNLKRGHTYTYEVWARARSVTHQARFARAQAQLDFGSKAIDAPSLRRGAKFVPGETAPPPYLPGVHLVFRVPHRHVKCP